MLTGAPGGARQREPRTPLGYLVRRWLRVHRMGGLRWLLNGRRLTWACAVMFALCIVYLAGSHIGPGLRAARGEGIRGEWVAQQCAGGTGNCSWRGYFMLPDGRVVMPNAMYAGSLASVHVGWTTRALDTGSSDEVYPLHGSERWIHDLIGLIGGTLAIVALLCRAAWVRHRHRRRRTRRSGIFLPL
jgi:hypothetical protein